jgi:radical SAM superfamily enzyme YgiQ (UPF0313 family)
VWGARCPAPPLGLITVAALLPPDWAIRLVDRNTRDLTDQDIDSADLVMTGGMLPQWPDTLKVIAQAQARGIPVVVGGPDAMSSPEVYAQADFRVLGEAEAILPKFIEAWSRGERQGTYDGERFTTDITMSPVPCFDLLEFGHYMYVGIQFSRGCPFNCEVGDIIELFGRVPRSKTAEQILDELQALYDAGYRGHVDLATTI